ncbi:YdcF family protein [Alteromonadaceae bacterium M269]|nr:YdcF family protein [Alteromonadaceae bacterium M269]
MTIIKNRTGSFIFIYLYLLICRGLRIITPPILLPKKQGFKLVNNTLSYIANTLASPVTHVPLIILVCWSVKILFKKDGKFLNITIYTAAIWFILCSLPYSSSLLIKSLEHRYPTIDYDSDKWQRADAIVVLACSFYEEPKLPFISRWHDCSVKRNVQAALMYQQKHVPIYLSGGLKKTSEKTHATFNQDFLKVFNVPTKDIHIVEEGFNTASEVKALSTLLKGKTVALVTSASHQIRAVNYFKRHGIDIIPIPVEHLSLPDTGLISGKPSATNLYRSERAIHEYLGLLAQSFGK